MTTEQDLNQWKHHPVTKLVFQKLSKRMDGVREDWCKASWDKPSITEHPDILFQLAQTRAYLKGQSEAFQDIIDIEVEDLNEQAEEG
ncbi:MAG: hypothetical protein AAF228_12530 [Pseudomonadota bacterium]